MIKEVEVDPDGSLTRRWGTRADDLRVERTMAALEANGITVFRAPDAAAAKRIVLELIPDASPVHQGPHKRSTCWVSPTRSKSPVVTRPSARGSGAWIARPRPTRFAAWARRRKSCSGACMR